MSLNPDILKYKPIQTFIEAVADDVVRYIGQNKVLVLSFGDEAEFYGEGIYTWLSKKKVPVIFSSMGYDCSGLNSSDFKDRKVLLVGFWFVTGASYQNALQEFEQRKEELGFLDVKSAVFRDRSGLADFSAERLVSSKDPLLAGFDETDLRIIRALSRDGRVSYADLAEDTGLTATGVKKRVEKMLGKEVLHIIGAPRIKKFYSVSALVNLEVDSRHVADVIKNLTEVPEVYFLVKVYDVHNVLVGLLATSLQEVDAFVEGRLTGVEGIRDVVVHVGDVPHLPEYVRRV